MHRLTKLILLVVITYMLWRLKMLKALFDLVLWFGFAALVIAAGVFAWSRYVELPRERRRLLAFFADTDRFVGMPLAEFVELAVAEIGPYRFAGAMDHGVDIVQWRGQDLLVEACFRDLICELVAVQDSRD